jgi:site-specific DNA-methyltransferase (adenine-specific)
MKIDLIRGDCLEKMKKIEDKSIDMILADLPYGTTACKWDTIIPFEPLWEQYKRIIKDNGAIVLTASQPFTSALVMSNLDMFRYELIWLKTRPSNVLNANKMFMKYHENILVFYNKLPTYNPQFENGKAYYKKDVGKRKEGNIYGKTGEKLGKEHFNDGYRHPLTVIKISNDNHNSLHPTQKPVALFEYLIKTYTNEGDTVLDNVMGSGTTGIACKNLNRQFIGIELDENYFNIAKKRIEKIEELKNNYLKLN